MLPLVRAADRAAVLRQAAALHREFLALCDSYALAPAPAPPAADPAARREAKIAQFRRERALKAQIAALSAREGADDEDLRALHTADLQLAAVKAAQALEMTALELEMLAQAPPADAVEERGEEYDLRSRAQRDDGYSERLDGVQGSIKGGALLSKDGRPLRPFTLLGKREQLKKGVFGPGHNLPTMSIDEYLEEERRRGGIIEGGGEKSGERPEPNEDDYEAVDAATMKARQWDEYTEANPKGAGNTLNRG